MVFWHQSGTNRHFALAPLKQARVNSRISCRMNQLSERAGLVKPQANEVA